jgi:hypothetical protein
MTSLHSAVSPHHTTISPPSAATFREVSNKQMDNAHDERVPHPVLGAVAEWRPSQTQAKIAEVNAADTVVTNDLALLV